MHQLPDLPDVDCEENAACAKLHYYLTLEVAFDERVRTGECRVEAGIWESCRYQFRDPFRGLSPFEEWVRSMWMPHFYYRRFTQSTVP